MSQLDAYIFDTETASLQGGVCDIGILQIDENLEVIGELESLINPERLISPSAMGIHHITDEMVADKPTLKQFMEANDLPFDRRDLIVAGHNVPFDCRMIEPYLPDTYRTIDTLKLARILWPLAEDHKLQTLRYTYRLEAGPAHRAMGDVITCLSLMRMVANERGIGLQGLLDLCRQPVSLDSKLPFGKHKGTSLRDLPGSYVKWLLEKADSLDPDLREALLTRS